MLLILRRRELYFFSVDVEAVLQPSLVYFIDGPVLYKEYTKTGQIFDFFFFSLEVTNNTCSLSEACKAHEWFKRSDTEQENNTT